MLHFWKWFCGYLCILLSGKNIHRFLNLCSRNGIKLWNIGYDINHKLRVHLRLRDFYILKPYIKKTKTRLKIIARRGFPFWCHRHPRLKWIFVFVFVLVGIYIYSFSFVWAINIDGNETITSKEIIEYLEQNEIKTGIKKEKIDCEQVEFLIREKYKGIGWVCVYVDKRELCVLLKESLYDIHSKEEHTTLQEDFIATKDAEIVSIITRTGTALVKKGDFVKKGQVLVVGQCALYNDIGEVSDILLLKADAQIIANTTYTFTSELSEIEIISLKIANQYNSKLIYFLSRYKLDQFMMDLEEDHIEVLNQSLMINNKERCISFSGIINAREEIGINKPVEESLNDEFK